MTDEHACFGFINLLKPPGMTSARAVGIVKRLLNGAKIGHAGTLDPEAAGVLPLMIGKAARLFDLLQDKEKEYIAEVAFGCETDTQDAQGKIVAVGSEIPTEEQVRSVMSEFMGAQKQRPPMYSALSQNGERLYDLARKGKIVEIPERDVFVKELTYLCSTPQNGAILRVQCSKGFYVRTLCTDIGKRLGCPSHMRFLLRTQSGPFRIENAVTLEEVSMAAEQKKLSSIFLQPQQVLPDLPVVAVPEQLIKAVRNGGLIPCGQFAKPNGIPSDEEKRFGLSIGNQLIGIAKRVGERVILTVWLGE